MSHLTITNKRFVAEKNDSMQHVLTNSSLICSERSKKEKIIANSEKNQGNLTTFADLFCGVGGFHLAAASQGLECVFASDIDANARAVYQQNFGMLPHGDITLINEDHIPDHDLLLAGFPCQPFSIIGQRFGFSDERGKLFFDIKRILAHKRPVALILENVKQLTRSANGQVIDSITGNLRELGYQIEWKVLDARDFGLPQKRERVLIVGALNNGLKHFKWPDSVPMPPLSGLLEQNPDKRHFASEHIRNARKTAHKATVKPAIWHENKGGNISSHPWSCALRAGASYNYLLVDGKRRLTPREMFRLQGFPDNFVHSNTDTQARKQAGNAVPVPMIRATMKALIDACKKNQTMR